jgi:hypothetical protein
MTIKALVYGGVQISGMTPRANCAFDGVHLQLNGSTLTNEGWKNAGISLDMSAADAMDLVSTLLDAVQKHSEYESKLIPSFAKRLNKRLEKRK